MVSVDPSKEVSRQRNDESQGSEPRCYVKNFLSKTIQDASARIQLCFIEKTKKAVHARFFERIVVTDGRMSRVQ